MTYPTTIGTVPELALPPVDEIRTTAGLLVFASDWRTQGTVQSRDRAAGRRPQDYEAIWLTVERAAVPAMRRHYELFRTGQPFLMRLPCVATPERVTYSGPFSIDWQSNSTARVSVGIARAFPSYV